WVEKYRPKDFNEIVSQDISTNNLQEFVKERFEMPHMIFTGPAGTGKTSTALIIADKLLKSDKYYRNVLELNASDTVRMKFVRNELNNFVSQNMILNENEIKLVILDEADNIPKTVQQTLRRIIEGSPSNVKFILLCNYINEIIDPIISRCAVFRFLKLPEEKIIERLKFIALKEDINIPKDKEKEFYNVLYFISAGDLRKAINTLQMAVALKLLKDLDNNEILKISGFVETPIMDKLAISLLNNDFKEVRNIFNSINNIDSRNFIRQLNTIILNMENIEKMELLKLRAFIGDIDYRISQRADEKIQLTALLSEILLRIKGKDKN
ncbi:MAG: AAA family ATPase, partial [Candidatus Lokiarchaeota archaeon]|nr:AAA family ATPase [Candidatus Lokiarchaeota archaeon]